MRKVYSHDSQPAAYVYTRRLAIEGFKAILDNAGNISMNRKRTDNRFGSEVGKVCCLYPCCNWNNYGKSAQIIVLPYILLSKW